MQIQVAEKFSLKWNDFQTNISRSFYKLRAENDFHDVTLVSDDQRLVSAHKLVLSSCSGYFEKILKQNKHENLLLCLEGISYTDLQHVLDYIYLGEVQIHQEQMDRFIYVAQRLQLDGLLLMNPEEYLQGKRQDEGVKSKQEDFFQRQDDGVKNNKHENIFETLKSEPILPHVNRVQQTFKSSKDNPKEQDLKTSFQITKTEHMLPPPVSDSTMEQQISSSAEGNEVLFENRTQLRTDRVEIPEEHYKDGKLISKEEFRSVLSEFYFRNNNRSYSCTVCHKVSDSQAHVREHVQTHLQGVNFPCPICKNNFRTTMARRKCFRKHSTSEYRTIDMNISAPIGKIEKIQERYQIPKEDITFKEANIQIETTANVEDLEMTVTSNEKEVATPEPIFLHGKPISNEEYETMKTEMYRQDGALFTCIICKKVFNKVNDVKEHVDVHMEGLNFQ